MSVLDIVLILLIGLVVILAVRRILTHKSGCRGCTGDCTRCAEANKKKDSE